MCEYHKIFFFGGGGGGGDGGTCRRSSEPQSRWHEQRDDVEAFKCLYYCPYVYKTLLLIQNTAPTKTLVILVSIKTFFTYGTSDNLL